MILDCFTFFNEIEMLLLRLHYLHDRVDKFVISESRKTFSGRDKPMYLKRYWKAIPSHIRDKIVVINADLQGDDGDPKASWVRERFQRSSLIGAVRRHICTTDATVIVSDVDEIPHKDLLIALGRTGIDRVAKLLQDCLVYNYANYTGPWTSSLIGPIEALTVENIERLRLSKGDALEDAGWHFTYFLSPEEIAHKLQSFAHTEFSSEKYTDLSTIQRLISERRDPVQRDSVADGKPYDVSRYPSDLKNLLDLYFPYQRDNLQN